MTMWPEIDRMHALSVQMYKNRTKENAHGKLKKKVLILNDFVDFIWQMKDNTFIHDK